MPIKIMLAIPTLNRLDLLIGMLTSVGSSTRIPDKVLIVNNGHQVTDQLREEWSRSFDLDIFTPQHNLGVAGSVNFAWKNTSPGWFWMHSNDDVILDPNCIKLMAETAELAPDNFIIPAHGEGSAFTVFMAHASMTDKLGYFDEQFFPAYAEDNDLGRRITLVGIARSIVKDAAYFHHVSSTLKAYTAEQERQHHEQFRANMERYQLKWGGPPDQERFTIPYNGLRGHHPENAHLWHKERIL